MELSKQLDGIRTGHIFLVLCCVFYLIWWSITFNPMKTFPSLPKYVLFLCIAVSGVTGGIFLIGQLGELPNIRGSVSITAILAAGAGTYVVLLYLTSHFLHRQVTTELFLIVGWTVLELCVLTGVYRANAAPFGYTAVMALVIVAAAIVSIICYLAYYNLKPVTGFYAGMIPLILFGAVMAAQAVMIRG